MRSEFDVEKCCKALEVSRSGYYKWRKNPLSNRDIENSKLLELIKGIHHQSNGIFGSPSIQAKLREMGENYNHKRVERVMRENNIRSKTKKKFKVTTDSKHSLGIAPNLLQRDFSPPDLNQMWCGDITYIWTEEGWLYLATVIDLKSRKVIGWALEDRMTKELVINAFNRAHKERGRPKGAIFHSDRGSQYASDDFKEALKDAGFAQSMSRKGNCWDNACAESFFASLKKEEVYHQRYQTKSQARQSVFWYIEVFYNRFRPHSHIGGVSPNTYEKLIEENVA